MVEDRLEREEDFVIINDLVLGFGEFLIIYILWMCFCIVLVLLLLLLLLLFLMESLFFFVRDIWLMNMGVIDVLIFFKWC